MSEGQYKKMISSKTKTFVKIEGQRRTFFYSQGWEIGQVICKEFDPEPCTDAGCFFQSTDGVQEISMLKQEALRNVSII